MSVVRMAQATNNVVSMNPNDFGPEFNVIHELTYNRDDYDGDEWVTAYSFPSYLESCVERIRVRVRRKPGRSKVVTCCIANGVQVLSEDESVTELLELRRQLYMSEGGGADEFEELAGWFRNFPMSVPDDSMSGTTKMNVKMPLDVKTSLGNFSEDLGVSQSKMMALSVMVTLSTQPELLRGQTRMIERGLARFLARVERRRRVAQVLLDTL